MKNRVVEMSPYPKPQQSVGFWLYPSDAIDKLEFNRTIETTQIFANQVQRKRNSQASFSEVS